MLRADNRGVITALRRFGRRENADIIRTPYYMFSSKFGFFILSMYLIFGMTGVGNTAPKPIPSAPTLGVPLVPTQNVGPPFELDECQPYYTGGLIIGKLAGFLAKFTNDTSLTADIVEIQILDANGDVMGTIRDVGKFSPGLEITHKYREGEGTLTFTGLFKRARVSCSIWVVHFTNGIVWRAQALPVGTYSQDATPNPSPTS